MRSRKASALTTIGLVAGPVGALIVCRLTAGPLYGAGIHDPATFVPAPLLLFAVAMLAVICLRAEQRNWSP